MSLIRVFLKECGPLMGGYTTNEKNSVGDSLHIWGEGMDLGISCTFLLVYWLLIAHVGNYRSSE